MIIRYASCFNRKAIQALLVALLYGTLFLSVNAFGENRGECIEGDCGNGQGIYLWANGNKYEGLFKDGRAHGEGTSAWPDGEGYVGSWKNGLMHGEGVYTYPDGTEYVGSFKNDKMDGEGIWRDGDLDEGRHVIHRREGGSTPL